MAVKADWAVGLLSEHDSKYSGLAHNLFLCYLFSLSQSLPKGYPAPLLCCTSTPDVLFPMYYVYLVPFYCLSLPSLFIPSLPPLCEYLYMTSSSTFSPHPFVLQHFFGHMPINKSGDLNCYHMLLEQFKSF